VATRREQIRNRFIKRTEDSLADAGLDTDGAARQMAMGPERAIVARPLHSFIRSVIKYWALGEEIQGAPEIKRWAVKHYDGQD
jgi:hypothetical protein